MQARRGPRRLMATAIVAGLLLPGTAVACTLDNVASLSANGVRAALTADGPSGRQAWAPFTVDKAFASGTTVRLAEAQADLARSLPPTLLAAPFRWTFGDGVAGVGHSAAHRYAQPGLYRVGVYAYDAAKHRWLLFDAALIHIVPAGQIVQANLGYYALQAFTLVFSSITRLITAVLGLLLLYLLGSSLWERVRRRPEGAGAAPEQERI